jgi:hypothetical protein
MSIAVHDTDDITLVQRHLAIAITLLSTAIIEGCSQKAGSGVRPQRLICHPVSTDEIMR